MKIQDGWGFLSLRPCRHTVAVPLLCLFVVCGLSAQSELLEKGSSGMGVSIDTVWEQRGFSGVSLATGYSISGALDLGFELGADFTEYQGEASTEMRMAANYNVCVIKQTAGVPLTFQIRGSYGLVKVSNDYLASNDYIMTATGYTFGLELQHRLPLSPSVQTLLALGGFYRSFNYVTTLESTQVIAEGDTGFPVRERFDGIYLGGRWGFLVRSKGRMVMAASVEVMTDQNLAWLVRPALSFVLPAPL